MGTSILGMCGGEFVIRSVELMVILQYRCMIDQGIINREVC